MADGILTEYRKRAMAEASIEPVGEHWWHAEIPACGGIWAVGQDVGEAREALQQVLEEWMLIRLQRGLGLPPVRGLDRDHDADSLMIEPMASGTEEAVAPAGRSRPAASR